jgi:uncharacterized membrane protein YoaK (UPF0700 family)
MPIPLALLLSAVGGYVDTVGFLALQELFTAHVTGNFVTLGMALTAGGTGAVAKLLALPVFCVGVILTQLAGRALSGRGRPVLRWLLWTQCMLLVLGAGLAVALHPFPYSDHPTALLTGMTFVAAMAVQNAAHRVHLPDAPPSTLMTGTTTQLMLDLADMIRGVPERPAVLARMRRMGASVAAFAIGCGLGAILLALVGPWAFALPALAVGLASCGVEAARVKAVPARA